MTKVKVLFFGAAKEIVGSDEEEFILPVGLSAQSAFETILRKNPALGEKFGKSLLFAVNQNYSNGEEIIESGDELAIFPPVSGGSDQSLSSLVLSP